MLCFSTWITLLILIGSVWSQTPDTEPSARSLKFGGALLEPARVVFCGTFCKNLGRLLFIRHIGCFVNCPELWGLPVTNRPAATSTMGSNPSSTMQQMGMGSNPSSTMQQMGMGSNSSSTMQQMGMGSNSSSTMQQIGMGSNSSSTMQQIGMGSNPPVQP